MKRARWIAAPIFAFVLASGSVLVAAQPPADTPGDSPCQSDVKKFCQGIEPGEGRILGCLKEHREQVSETCKVRLAQMRVKTKPTQGRPPARGN